MAASVKDLVDSGNQLASSIKSDFTGLKAVKLPGVLKGLTSTTKDLVEIGKSIAQTVAALKEIK